MPRTILVNMTPDVFRDVFRVFDGDAMTEVSRPFFDVLRAAADNFGYPCFLRTGQTSGKHNWENTCFLPNAEALEQHVVNIIEFSECAQLVGLACDVWAVREMLPTEPVGLAPGYGNMPLCREFRFFVADGEVRCWHPYWPIGSLEQSGADIALHDKLSSTDDYVGAFTLAHKSARAIAGAWSVDVLKTSRGWYVTDMAEAAKSYHDGDCNSMDRWL